MADFDPRIPFPCFAGCVGRAEGSDVYIEEFTTQVAGKRCVPLFTERYLVEEYFQREDTLRDEREKLTVHAFAEMDDLADYLLFRWMVEAGAASHYVLIGHYGNHLMAPELISQLLYRYDQDALTAFLRHAPYCEGLVETGEGQECLVFSTVTSVYNAGAFVLTSEGGVWLPEGLEVVASDGEGQLALLDEQGAIRNLIHAGSEVTCWGGVLRFARGVPPWEFEFQATDASTWNYRYDPQLGWYERQLSGGSPPTAAGDPPAGLVRCCVCRTWNRQGTYECQMCHASLMVPHCLKCGAELEEETDACPVCEGKDLEG